MRINKVLSKHIKNLNIKLDEVNDLILDNELQSLLDKGFSISKITSCTYFSEYEIEESNDLIRRLGDNTGLECFLNDISIDSYINESVNVLPQGILFAIKLAELFKGDNKNFKVILSYDMDSCTVRFHQERKGESWIDDDINRFQEEGIAIFE